jgi:uncharacterized protein YcbK (DUF882 family)
MDRRRFLAIASSLLASYGGTAFAALAPSTPQRLSLHNAHTGENFDGPYRDEKGPIVSAMEDLSHFLRDHHSGKQIAYDVAALDFLAATMAAVGATKATILSAYRTPETNAMLARTTFGVADNSQHMYGRALDVRLDSGLEQAMQAARSMQRGGVGWYPRSSFIHLDSGPVRNWTLEGGGLDNLLMRIRAMIARNSGGKIPVGHGSGPLSVRQRLALHRMIAKAEFVTRNR